ncbi:putative membrane protein [Desulfamplus magnetovallimortis]|uniref:Putative membrane protein n=1 Tax=Desulfamplus magnetovallimortis TaxID=1246637 RepID=A0A1W1HCA2_9BACT|nr:peptidoglycan DD-metalloendopeptidase family protein [Desulfamplus magnetovallimortis]SLM30015.1 putative membrane protein [Desulfamplus magnetovallimortis]
MDDFLKSIEHINHLQICASREWIFHPGMLFGSWLKWWGSPGYRKTAHEGIDIAQYRNRNGDIVSLSQDIMIPAMVDSTILNICDDFLGRSVIAGFGRSLAIVYSHIAPDTSLKAGDFVAAGKILGTVADTSMRKSGIGAHLHISLMEIARYLSLDDLNWNLFVSKDQDYIYFYNPIYIPRKFLNDDGFGSIEKY